MEFTTQNFKILNQKLLSRSKKLPLHSEEVVSISQKLDYFVVQALKRQLEKKSITLKIGL